MGWNDGRLGGDFVDAGAGCFLLGLDHAFEEQGDWAFAFCDVGDFGAGGQDAEVGVDDDLFYSFGFGGGLGFG
jgi:hypothetical protein